MNDDGLSSRLSSAGEEEERENRKNKTKGQVAKLGSGESYTDENGDKYSRTDYADGSNVITKTSRDGEVTYKDGEKYVSKTEYASRNEKSQWYQNEMATLIDTQKKDFTALLKTPE